MGLFSVVKAAVLAIIAIGSVHSKVINITVMTPGITAISDILKQLDENGEDPESFGDLDDYGPEYYTESSNYNYTYDYTYGFSDCSEYKTDLERIKCLKLGYKFYPWSYIFVKPALEIALKKINEMGIIEGHEIQLQYRDCGGEQGIASSRISQIASVDARMQDQMAVMIGPMSSYSTSRVAAFTTHWEILLMSPGSTSSGLRKNDHLINTLVRTGPVSTQVGSSVSAVLNYHGWTQTCIEVFEDDLKERPYYFLAEGIYEEITNNNSEYIVDQVRLSEFPNEDETYSYSEVLMSVREFGRIIVLSAADNVVREFLKKADEHNYSNKEFVYIIVDLEDKLGPTPWIWTDHTGVVHNDTGIQRVLESALIIRLKSRKNDREYGEFVTKMIAQLGKDIVKGEFNETRANMAVEALADKERYPASDMKEYFEKNLYPAIFHDTLLMVADIINSSIAEELARNPEKDSTELLKEALGGRHLVEDYIVGKSFRGG